MRNCECSGVDRRLDSLCRAAACGGRPARPVWHLVVHRGQGHRRWYPCGQSAQVGRRPDRAGNGHQGRPPLPDELLLEGPGAGRCGRRGPGPGHLPAIDRCRRKDQGQQRHGRCLHQRRPDDGEAQAREGIAALVLPRDHPRPERQVPPALEGLPQHGHQLPGPRRACLGGDVRLCRLPGRSAARQRADGPRIPQQGRQGRSGPRAGLRRSPADGRRPQRREQARRPRRSAGPVRHSHAVDRRSRRQSHAGPLSGANRNTT